jgi:hypothetical protein
MVEQHAELTGVGAHAIQRHRELVLTGDDHPHPPFGVGEAVVDPGDRLLESSHPGTGDANEPDGPHSQDREPRRRQCSEHQNRDQHLVVDQPVHGGQYATDAVGLRGCPRIG